MTMIDNSPVSEVLQQYVILQDSKQVNAFILIMHLVMMIWLKW